MPRRLIGDVHEWNNEASTVPACSSAKPQPEERFWKMLKGKEDPLELDSSMTMRNELSGPVKKGAPASMKDLHGKSRSTNRQ